MNFSNIAAIIASGVTFSSVSLADKAPSMGTYSLDAAHSKVGFEISHLVISSVEGRFAQFSGALVLADKFENSTLNTTIMTSSVDTAMPDRDKHLTAADFFDSKKFPSMTFKSTKIEGTPEAFKVTGDLSVKGVTKPVTLEAKYLGTVKDAFGNTKAAFRAKGKLNRKDFGLTWSKMVEAGPVVGDDVILDFKIQAKAEAKIEPKADMKK